MDLNLKAMMEFNSRNMTNYKKDQIFRATKYNLLDISEPLMIAFRQLNTYYFVYALQNRTITMKNKEIADIQELLIVETTLNTIIDLLEEKIDIKYSLFSPNSNIYRTGKIGGNLFPKIKVNNFEEIESKLPLSGVKLDDKLPNKNDPKKTLYFLKNELEHWESFLSSSEIIDKTAELYFDNDQQLEDYEEYISSKSLNSKSYIFEVKL